MELSLIFFVGETDSLENILEEVTILIKIFVAFLPTMNILFFSQYKVTHKLFCRLQ